MRDLARLAAAQHLELTVRVDGLLPFLLALVNADELLERGLGKRRAVTKLREQLLGSIEQAGSEVVFGEREQGLMALCFVEVRARQQILVDANRPLHLAAPPEQMPQGEVRLERVVV